MAFFLNPFSPVFQYFTGVGVILAGGKINTYLAGTTTPTPTYTDSTGGVQNANPIILNSQGQLPNEIWQAAGAILKIIITDKDNNQIGPTFDNLPGINDIANSLPPSAVISNFTATYVGGLTAPTGTVYYAAAGNLIMLNVPALSATSSSTSFSLSGLPPAIIPPLGANLQITSLLAGTDNGARTTDVQAQFAAQNSSIVLLKGGSSTGWTAAGTKAIGPIIISFFRDSHAIQ